MADVPPLAALPARPQRVILHWTGGGPRASAFECEHYHYLVQQDLVVVRGMQVALNMRACGTGVDYAAHTRGFNSYSVGVSFCGMLGAVQGGSMGKHPLTEPQVEAGCAFIAKLCREWGLAPTVDQVFTHAEAQRVHGRPQQWKWDIDVLPWRQATPEENGRYLRERIAAHMPEVVAA